MTGNSTDNKIHEVEPRRPVADLVEGAIKKPALMRAFSAAILLTVEALFAGPANADLIAQALAMFKPSTTPSRKSKTRAE